MRRILIGVALLLACGGRAESEGDEREGFAAGTAWSEIPDSWGCPDCGVRDKVDFEPVEDSA